MTERLLSNASVANMPQSWPQQCRVSDGLSAGVAGTFFNILKDLCRVVTGSDGFLAGTLYMRAGSGEWFDPALVGTTRHSARATQPQFRKAGE